MVVGEVLFKSLSSGVITEAEVGWLASEQTNFNRTEEAAVLRLGRLIDNGQINLGCRIPSSLRHHKQVLDEWIEPLGRNRNS